MQNHTLLTSLHQGRECSRAAGVKGHRYSGFTAQNPTITAISEVSLEFVPTEGLPGWPSRLDSRGGTPQTET